MQPSISAAAANARATTVRNAADSLPQEISDETELHIDLQAIERLLEDRTLEDDAEHCREPSVSESAQHSRATSLSSFTSSAPSSASSTSRGLPSDPSSVASSPDQHIFRRIAAAPATTTTLQFRSVTTPKLASVDELPDAADYQEAPAHPDALPDAELPAPFAKHAHTHSRGGGSGTIPYEPGLAYYQHSRSSSPTPSVEQFSSTSLSSVERDRSQAPSPSQLSLSPVPYYHPQCTSPPLPTTAAYADATASTFSAPIPTHAPPALSHSLSAPLAHYPGSMLSRPSPAPVAATLFPPLHPHTPSHLQHTTPVRAPGLSRHSSLPARPPSPMHAHAQHILSQPMTLPQPQTQSHAFTAASSMSLYGHPQVQTPARDTYAYQRPQTQQHYTLPYAHSFSPVHTYPQSHTFTQHTQEALSPVSSSFVPSPTLSHSASLSVSSPSAHTHTSASAAQAIPPQYIPATMPAPPNRSYRAQQEAQRERDRATLNRFRHSHYRQGRGSPS